MYARLLLLVVVVVTEHTTLHYTILTDTDTDLTDRLTGGLTLLPSDPPLDDGTVAWTRFRVCLVLVLSNLPPPTGLVHTRVVASPSLTRPVKLSRSSPAR